VILINKSTVAPAHLAQGAAVTAIDCADFDHESLSFVEGHRVHAFDKGIYGHGLVKGVLEAAQFGKCCYCEIKFRAASPGDVEHFRPKTEVRQGRGQPAERPGYYWLAYSWDNLFFSCPICNRSNKKNFFPLAKPIARARIHTDNLASEQPLLLNPAGPDDPRNHIHFHREIPVGVTSKGRRTIEILKLDRPALNEERLVIANRLNMLRKIVAIQQGNPTPRWASIVAEAQTEIDNSIRPEAVFSAMAQDLLS